MKIVILDGYTTNPGDLSWDALAALGELTAHDRTDFAQVAETIGDAEIVFTNKCPITADIIKAHSNLKFIGVLATGYNIVDADAAKECGIPVCNVPGYGSASVAQTTIALLLEVAHHVGATDRAVHDGQWTRGSDFCFWNYPIFELEGKTLGIIGHGSIGQRVAQIAVALGMRVFAYSRTRRAELETDKITIVTFDEVLEKSDVISLHCPQNEDSAGLINSASIARMRDGVILLNTARGGCVVERDLAAALDSGKVAWYAADVVSVEPIRADNPLLKSPNTIITPHYAWAALESRTRLIDISVQNLRAFLDGRPQNVVNA